MKNRYSRRQALKTMASVSATAFLPSALKPATARSLGGIQVAGRDVEIQITSISAHTVQLTISPLKAGQATAVPQDGSLVQKDWGAPAATLRNPGGKTINCGDLSVRMIATPMMFVVANSQGDVVQTFKVNAATGALSFVTGDSPLLGLGEGGPQFDRRGFVDEMRSGQGGY